MKRITLNGNLLKGLALIAMLSNCQNEELATQNIQTVITSEDRNAKTIFTPQLLKEGANELEYYGDYDVNRGKLKKLTNTIENVYTDYKYDGSTIIAQRRNSFTNAMIYQVTYQLDGLGRCMESLSTETNKSFKYEYGQLSRLIKAYNKANPNERMEFGYEQGTTTALKSVNFFNQSNAATKEVIFSYIVQGGNPMQNKYPTNPDALGVTSKYLPIFGTFHSYLPTFESTKNLPWNGDPFPGYSLTYLFNADGYAKTINSTNSMNGMTTVTSRTYTTPKL
ncbi:hypothetical protein [Dyadobacter jiangsuensis]|uniref:YD repeat-containing protein n=1 Tax=Dyadobacter jiangsuensis TaxID=1591085 RepID=A0A2P8GFX2_9BACT|nr:hypothetical protein [Dyadobacter jiangsuensis]PSL32847.1 hypothetical protein CLV60_102566 [Dyadobacter jiangsuensis]